MKRIMLVVTMLLVALPALAAEITEEGVRHFFNDWLAAQNNGSFSPYADLYSRRFVGIRRSGKSTKKFDHDAWLNDRKKMFKKKMIVTSGDPQIKISGSTASISFEQTWESGTYKDKGQKVLDVALDEGMMRIVREEMLASKVIYASNDSKYTSLKSKDCRKSQMLMDLTTEEHAEECPGLDGWKLYKVYEHEGRSWIDIGHKNSIWTTRDQVWNDSKYRFGHFPSVDAPTAEWRITDTGKPTALIFRVTAQDPETADSLLSRLFVVNLNDKIPRFCGIAKTNTEARKIADNAEICDTVLSHE